MQTRSGFVPRLLTAAAALAAISAGTAAARAADPPALAIRDAASAGEPHIVRHSPTRPATRRWTLCAVFPHIKDAYWLGVNFGMIEEARRLGVEIRFREAAGYPNLDIQAEQVRACAESPDVDALIVGPVSRDGLSPLLQDIARRMPVLATVNAIDDRGIAARVGVNWYEMGRAAGDYLVAHLPPSREPVPVAWFPGPRTVSAVVDQGFRDAIAGSRIVIATTAWGDTGKSIQRNLVQAALDAHPEVRFLVGNGLMAEAAVSVLRERELQQRVSILSTYLTPAVLRGIVRGRILAAPTDFPVLQGRLSVGQAVDLLEKRPFPRDFGPVIRIVDRASLKHVAIDESIPPSGFVPTFLYKPQSPPARQ
ncbi:MAG: TMAO reductase system periplasmic protein TorT [Proteobacteria bacterium]|nr:TMAO reductase system periplasmic protein TorT [Pseudomonadota bacterium]